MSTQPARILLVGCGAVTTELYAPALRRLAKQGELNVAGLMDPDPQRLRILHRQFPKAACDTELDTALASRDATLAIIASPAAFHASQTIRALEHGLHVLCEKPIAVTSVEGHAMLSAAERAGRRLFVGLPRRLFPAVREIARYLQESRCGNHVTFSYHEGSRYTWPVASQGALRRVSGGGGVLMDKGAHAIDVLIGLFGAPDDVQYSDDALDGGIETNCVLSWQREGVTGSVTLSWDQELVNALSITGDRGEITWDLGHPDRFRWKSLTGPAQTVVAGTTPSPRNYFDYIALETTEVLRAIGSGEASALDAASALPAVRLIEQCYQHARPLVPSWLPAEEQMACVQRHWALRA